MPNIVANNIVEITAYATFAGQLGVNRMHYKAGNQVGAGADMQVAITALEASFRPFYLPVMADTATWFGMAIRKIFPLPVSVLIGEKSNPAAGTAAGKALPSQSRPLIVKRTIIAGPAGRGRMYLFFPSTGMMDLVGGSGQLSVTAFTDVQNLASEYFQILSVGTITDSIDLTPVLKAANPGTVTTLDSMTARFGVATQRRSGFYGRLNTTPF